MAIYPAIYPYLFIIFQFFSKNFNNISCETFFRISCTVWRQNKSSIENRPQLGAIKYINQSSNSVNHAGMCVNSAAFSVFSAHCML